MTANKQLEKFLEVTNNKLNLAKSEDDENVSYVNPSIEASLHKDKRQACRDILLEIRNFGISQRQTLYLIYLLALELEDQVAMKSITQAVSSNREQVKLTKADTQDNAVSANAKKKIII